MAEYKNGVSALGNVSVSKEDTAAEVQTGRVVFVDEDKYEKDAAYKAKVDKCVEEGFMRSDEAGSGSGGSGGGGTEPLIVNIVAGGGEASGDTLDKTWQEIHDAFPNVILRSVVSSLGSEKELLYAVINVRETSNLEGTYYNVDALQGQTNFVVYNTDDPNGYPHF